MKISSSISSKIFYSNSSFIRSEIHWEVYCIILFYLILLYDVKLGFRFIESKIFDASYIHYLKLFLAKFYLSYTSLSINLLSKSFPNSIIFSINSGEVLVYLHTSSLFPITFYFSIKNATGSDATMSSDICIIDNISLYLNLLIALSIVSMTFVLSVSYF